MTEAVDVAIVGAGPYGLSLGAHLRRAGVSMRQFGKVIDSWRTAMPNRMYLTSPAAASSLSGPDGTHTLRAFCRETGRGGAPNGLPVPLADFVAYGEWFAAGLVPGGGQSALEIAALLHEQGTDVQIVLREPELAWHGPASAEPFGARHPGLFRRLPEAVRVSRAHAEPRPGGANWLRPRVEGKIPALTGHSLRWARPLPGGVRVGLDGPGGHWELFADHLIAATGYRPDLGRLPFLDGELRAALRTVAGAPAVGRDYQSSVPGLYFVGPAVAPVSGPALRLLSGAGPATRGLAARLTATAWLRTPSYAGKAPHASGW
jgi:FAD binding domain-containing protein